MRLWRATTVSISAISTRRRGAVERSEYTEIARMLQGLRKAWGDHDERCVSAFCPSCLLDR